jgi:hypothetical protein
MLNGYFIFQSGGAVEAEMKNHLIIYNIFENNQGDKHV